MKRNFINLALSCFLMMSCGNATGTKIVTADEYISDKNCWSGDRGRFKGIGVFSGDVTQRFFLLSAKCRVGNADERFQAFANLGILRISDKRGLTIQAIGKNPYPSNNFTTPVAIPSEKNTLYLVDIVLQKIESDGYIYFEVMKVNRFDATEFNLQDLNISFDNVSKKIMKLIDTK